MRRKPRLDFVIFYARRKCLDPFVISFLTFCIRCSNEARLETQSTQDLRQSVSPH